MNESKSSFSCGVLVCVLVAGIIVPGDATAGKGDGQAIRAAAPVSVSSQAQSTTKELRIQKTQASLTEALAQLPAPELSRPYRFLRSRPVTQAEAEQLMGNADAALYLADRQEIRFLLGFAADVDIERVGAATAMSANTAKLLSDTPLPLTQRTEELGVATLVEFADVIARDLPSPDVAQQANFIVKLPSVIARPNDGLEVASKPPLPAKSVDATDYYISQDFEADVWSYWTRGDNTGGRYTWAAKSCNPHWGSYSVDPVRGGTEGAYLGCASNYPQSVRTWMYSSLCQSVGSGWNAWLHMYLRGAIGSEDDDYFAVWALSSDDYLWGYYFWGNWQSWFKIVFNLKQWYKLGDLSQNYCNTLYLDFQSSSAAAAGSGPSIDDFRIDYGPTASTNGQCQILADPASGPAPLTVAFRGLTDLTYGTYYWDFKDGSTSTARDPVHTFTTPGTYEIYFRAQYSDISGRASATVTVLPGITCSYSLSTPSQSFSSAGGTGSVGVASPSGCAWTASSNVAWITVTSGASGSGNGTVGYSVAANSGSARSGTVTIAGQTFTVNQDGASVNLSFSHWIAAASHTDGAGGSHWRSDVAVLNRSSSQATIEYRLYTPGGVRTQQIALASNAQDFHRDIAAWLGYSTGSGALEVRSNQDVFVMGRTYNQVDTTHTFGQNYDGQEADSTLLSVGQSAWLPLLAQNSGFRCNIAVTNTGTTTANVTLALYDSNGTLMWSGNNESSALAPGGFVQYQTPFQKYAGRNDLEHAYAKVTVNSGTGIIVWASVVDNATGDPTTIFMKR